MDATAIAKQVALAAVDTHLTMRDVLRDRIQAMDEDVFDAQKRLIAAQARAAAVRKQLASIEDTIHRSQRELAPVLSLPHDILCEILRLWAQSEHTHTARPHPGFVASKVCRAWRDVAVASPSAWAYLKLDCEVLGGNSRHRAAVLRSVQLQLERSASAPLNVYMINYNAAAARRRRGYGAPLEAVIAHAARWRSFHLSGNVTEPSNESFQPDYLAFYFSVRTPLLEHFSLNMGGSSPTSTGVEIPFLPVAPRLRTLTLCPEIIGTYQLVFPELPELEVLEVNPGAVKERGAISLLWVWAALKQWPHIRELRTLWTSELWIHSDDDMPDEPLLMPNLETIRVDATMDTLDGIVPMLRLPKLHTVDFALPAKKRRHECELFKRHGRSIRHLQLTGGWAPRDISGFVNLETLTLRRVGIEGVFFSALAPRQGEYPCKRLRVLRTEQCRFVTPIIGANVARFVANRTVHAAERKVARLEDVVLSSAEDLEAIQTVDGTSLVEGLPVWLHEYVRRAVAGDELLAVPDTDD